MVVSRRVGFRYRGACEGGANPLNELDHALAMIGSAHWIENFSTSAPRNRRQSTSLKWQPWGMNTRSRGQGRTAGVGFESGRLVVMIDEGGF
jgi:hypothetical protein